MHFRLNGGPDDGVEIELPNPAASIYVPIRRRDTVTTWPSETQEYVMTECSVYKNVIGTPEFLYSGKAVR
jgi:hypothetical protein